MPDIQEVELKFALPRPDAARSVLEQLGFVAEGRRFERNIRLDDPSHALTSRQVVLRVREITVGDTASAILTVKTNLSAANDGPISSRREIELDVSDGPALLAALEVLGYLPFLLYEKRREVFRSGPVEVVIDEMPFGWFLEIEGPESDIQTVAEALGLPPSEALTLSYAELCVRASDQFGLDLQNMTFEAFAGLSVPTGFYR